MDFPQIDGCLNIIKEEINEYRRIRENISTIQIPQAPNQKKDFINNQIAQNAMQEEQKLLLSIKSLKKNLKKKMIHIKKLEQENECKRELKEEEEVLEELIGLYEKYFKLNIEIEKNLEKTYSAEINLQINESTFPVKVVIDKKNKVLIDFDATSIISKQHMDEIKDKYIGKHCGLSSLIVYLRKLKLSQV